MSIQKNLDTITSQINKACAISGRSSDEVTLIAVTKTKPVEDMKEALDYGIKNVGENKVQEIRDKYPVFKDSFTWHMIGHLQRNKIKYIIDKVELIHSVDTKKLARAVNKEAEKHNKVMDILVQVNVAEEDSKFGLSVEESELFIRDISILDFIRIRGLMTVAPYVENPESNRAIFRKMKQIFVDINSKNIDNVNMDILSMGMTNDFQVAIEEGSTMVRIGTAIFGERNYSK